jgi:hypothetical protein
MKTVGELLPVLNASSSSDIVTLPHVTELTWLFAPESPLLGIMPWLVYNATTSHCPAAGVAERFLVSVAVVAEARITVED